MKILNLTNLETSDIKFKIYWCFENEYENFDKPKHKLWRKKVKGFSG